MAAWSGAFSPDFCAFGQAHVSGVGCKQSKGRFPPILRVRTNGMLVLVCSAV